MRNSVENPVKLNRRALALLSRDVLPSIRWPLTLELAAAYAAQNPGFEGANYGGCAAAYRSDSRRATQGLHAVERALAAAHAVRVSDADMLDASRGERFAILGDAVGGYSCEYTTGQYFPVEFRWQVARVIEQAARIALRREQAAKE